MAFDMYSDLDHDEWEQSGRSGTNEQSSVMTVAETDPIHAPRPSPPTIQARRTLPSSRAVVGAAILTIGTLGSFALATGGDDEPTTSYLVATRDLEAGETITIDDVHFEPMQLSADLSATTLNSRHGLEGAVVLHDLSAGELVDVSHLAGATTFDGESLATVHEVAFGIPLDRSPAGLVPSDRVTVLATTNGTTTLAVEDAVVLTIDSQPDRVGSNGRGILTLAVDDPRTVMKIAHLTLVADITVVRSTRALDDRYPESVGGGETGQ